MGVLVRVNTYRHPAVLAQMAATLDAISDGRLDLGIGVGWHEREHEAYGLELPSVRERFDRFDEAIEVIHLLLTEDVASFDGAHYRLRQARCEPKPVQQPRLPLVIGGGGEQRTLRTAARWADHWNLVVRDMDLEPFRRKLAVLARWCDTVGRPFDEIEKSAQIHAEDPASLPDRCARIGEVQLNRFRFDLIEYIFQIVGIETYLEPIRFVISRNFLCRRAIVWRSDRKRDLVGIQTELHRTGLLGRNCRNTVNTLVETLRIKL